MEDTATVNEEEEKKKKKKKNRKNKTKDDGVASDVRIEKAPDSTNTNTTTTQSIGTENNVYNTSLPHLS